MFPTKALFYLLSHGQVDNHMLKVNGVRIFGSLHMTVNEWGEVRAWTLTSTKGHDQCMPSLAAIPHSLKKYGHEDTEIAFTDNPRADKAELERAIPALRKHVIPVPSSSTEQLVLPDDWKNQIFILKTTYQVNTHLNSLMEEDLQNPEPGNHTYQLDLEWSIDLVNSIQGHIGLISLVHNQSVFSFRSVYLPMLTSVPFIQLLHL